MSQPIESFAALVAAMDNKQSEPWEIPPGDGVITLVTGQTVEARSIGPCTMVDVRHGDIISTAWDEDTQQHLYARVMSSRVWPNNILDFSPEQRLLLETYQARYPGSTLYRLVAETPGGTWEIIQPPSRVMFGLWCTSPLHWHYRHGR
jgi:hypothetical protein